MARRRYYDRDDEIDRLLSGALALGIVFLVWYFYTDPSGATGLTLLIVGCVFLYKFLKKRRAQNRLRNLLEKVKSSGQEDYFQNFISRFGFEGGKGDGYTFRNHKFDWDRINDLQKILKEKGVTSNNKDVFILLRYYIQNKEEQITRESILKQPQRFASLTGPDFEKLLYRLFEKMGYKVELIGKSGDQGGDLIANNNGERVLIQAKCYRDWSTGNGAVQQVVGAMKLYDCNKAMVITTSYFTPEAISLAKANQTELVSKERLQELLSTHLGESWL